MRAPVRPLRRRRRRRRRPQGFAKETEFSSHVGAHAAHGVGVGPEALSEEELDAAEALLFEGEGRLELSLDRGLAQSGDIRLQRSGEGTAEELADRRAEVLAG